MSTRFLPVRSDLLHLAVIAALLMLVLMHLPAAYESYRIRDRVLAGIEQSQRAKELVAANALQGKRFEQGWVDTVAGVRSGISIEPHTAVITITYPADIDGGDKTLVLVPMYRVENQVYPLATKVNSKVPLVTANLIWVCTSTLTRSRISFISDHLGTLQSKYAPAECRISLQLSGPEESGQAALNNR